MRHSSILEVLRLCPASKYFGVIEQNLNTRTLPLEQARSYALEMINEFNFSSENFDDISE